MSVNSTFVGSPAQLYGVVGTGNVVLASALPTTKAPVGHVFLTGYNASTTLFSQGQPSTADLSDWSDAGVANGDVPIWNASLGQWVPGVLVDNDAQTIAKVTHQWLDSYNAGTGLFTQSQPAYSDLSGAPAVTTINPTNGLIPVRSNATTFVDSPLTVAGSGVTGSITSTTPIVGVADQSHHYPAFQTGGYGFGVGTNGYPYIGQTGAYPTLVAGTSRIRIPSS